MTNEIMILENVEFGEIRTIVDLNEKVYFCGSDVATALGYKRPIEAVNQHCKIDGTVKHRIIDSIGRMQEMVFISEGNLYRLITKSKLHEAEKFERWVFDEVLPDIRKNGMYAKNELLDNPEFLLDVIKKLKDERQEKNILTLVNNELKNIIEEAKPKIEYCERILQSHSTMTVTQVGADYGISAIKLNRILAEEKIQYKCSGQWILYEKYKNLGFYNSEMIEYMVNGELRTYPHTKWTQKGRLFIHKILEQRGIFPVE